MNTWHKLKWPLIALGVILLFNLLVPPGMLETLAKGNFSDAFALFKENNFFRLQIKDGRVYGSLIDILHRAAPVMLIALGMTLVIATGGVDLSVGSVMAIAGALAALFLSGQAASVGWASDLPVWGGILSVVKSLLFHVSQSVPLIVIVSLGAAALLGLWNGALVGFFGVTPIVATLILMVSGRGIAQLLSGGQMIPFDNKTFEFIGRGTFLALPFTITLVVVVFGFLSVFTRRTAAGLFIESTGDNEKASRYAGVNTNSVKMLVYAVCALLAGLAGLIAVTDIKASDASNVGQMIELDAILAVVIGGTALTGGRYFFAGSLVGAILIQTMTTTILTRGVPVQWTQVVKALVIIFVCLLQSETFRRLIMPRSKKANV